MNKARLIRYSVIAIAFGGLFFTLGFFNKYHLPRFKQWALIEIEKQSREHLPVRTWPESITINAFPLGVTIHNVKVLPKEELAGAIAPFKVHRINISVGLTHLIQGRLRLNRVELDGTDITYIIKKSEPNKKTGNNPAPEAHSFNLPFKKISAFPISELSIKNIDLKIFDKNTNYIGQIADIEAKVLNNPLGFIFEFNSPAIQFKKRGESERLRFSTDLQVLLEKDALYVSKLSINKGDVFFIANGKISGDMETLKPEEAKAQMRSNINLSEVDSLIQEVGLKLQLPRLQGLLKSDLAATYNWTNKTYNLDININTKDLIVDGFVVGDVSAVGTATDSTYALNSFNIQSSAGNLSISDFKFKNIGTKKSFDLNLIASPLKLQPLLENLKVGKIPVELPMESNLPCSGEIAPKFFIECRGQVKASYLKVQSDIAPEAFKIVDLNEFSVDGSVRVDSHKVVYDTNIQLGSSKGHSKGEISYESGFNIFYSSPDLDLSNVANLAQLKLEGKTKITGNTKGNSSYATIDAQIKTQDVWLDDYGLGNFESHLKYKAGMLNFNNIRGNYNSSRFSGHLALNLLKNRIFIEGESPFIDAQDALDIFSRVATINTPVTGTGSFKVKARGPFSFNKLSYDFDAQIFKGSISNENFDKLAFSVSSDKGFVKSKNIYLTKDDGSIEVQGTVDPKAQAHLKILGKNLRIEDSEIMRRLSLNLTGLLDFNMKYTSHLLSPNIEGEGRIHKMVVGDRPTEESKFTGSITKEAIELRGNFIGDVVSTHIKYPIADNRPFLFELKTRNWDFTRLFGVFSDAVATGEYVTHLSSDLKFESPNGSLKSAKGEMLITDFSVRRGPVAMYAPRPMKLSLRNEQIELQDFIVEGKNTFLKFLSKPQSSKGMNLTLDGKIDMSLASLLAPFLDELRGNLSLSLAMNGALSEPILIGSAYVDQAFVKFKGFPHSLGQLKADILFNHKNIVINAAKGKLAEGSFTSAGTIKIHAAKDIEVDIKGQIKDGAFNVPEGFRTFGSGDIYFKGNWFPYTLGGNFIVDRGRVDKNLANQIGGEKDITPSDFLPKFLLKQNFQPLVLDLNVNIRNPVPVKLLVSGLDIATPITGNLNIKGTPDAPILNGQIDTGKDGAVHFRGNKFELRIGTVKFKNTSPDNPSLYVSAESRIEAKNASGDDETKEYDIALTVQGTAKAPQVSVASQPPLPENELVSLLTLGFVTSDKGAENTNLQSKVTNTSVQLGSSFISNQLSQTAFSRSVQDSLGLEFGFSSEFDDKVEETVTKFFVKKKVTNQLDVTASRSTGIDKETNFAGTYKLNRNVSVVGTYDFKEGSANESTTQDSKSEFFGLDLEYKIEFK